MSEGEGKFTKLFCPICNYISNLSGNKDTTEKCIACGYDKCILIPSNRIFTESPDIALWYCLRKLKYKNFLREVIENKLKRDCRKFDTSGYPQATLDDITTQSELVTMALSQAEEYYNHANVADIAVSPVLYFYGMISFIKALLACTYKFDTYRANIKKHGVQNIGGLELKDGVKILKDGEFQVFFKCASAQAQAKLDKLSDSHKFISIEQLFNSIPTFYSDFISKDKLPHWPVSMVVFLLIFKLASVCRYEPEIWRKFIAGDLGQSSYLFEKVIYLAKRKFPEWILILIAGANYEFGIGMTFESMHDRYEKM